MLITHGHADHFVDVIPAFYARHYGDLGRARPPFYSPDGFIEGIAALLVSGERPQRDGRGVRLPHRPTPAMSSSVGPFRVTTFEMTHIGVNSLGYRIEAGGAVLAYTGDTGPCDEVIELARDADLFLCEATYQDPSSTGVLPPERRRRRPSTPTAAGVRAVGAHAPHADARPRGVSRDEAAGRSTA